MTHLLISVVTLIQLALPGGQNNSQSVSRADSAGPLATPVATAFANDNRNPTGVLRDGVLTVRLDARAASWRPESSGGKLLSGFAFAEEGKMASIPGPVIRAAAGTEVRAFIHNSTGKPLLMRGLQERPSSRTDSIDIAAGDTHEFRFRAGTRGTYYYYGRTDGDRIGLGFVEDSQLIGVIIIDPPGERPEADRTFLITGWFDDGDTSAASRRPAAEHFFVNGKSWPYTERIQAIVGDSLRWRVVNGTIAPHPMHLHGFYYDIVERGGESQDTVYARGAIRKAVTEFLPTGNTMLIVWSPDRAGNWLFHCHLIAHISRERRVDDEMPHRLGAHMNHATEGMAGLIVGIQVRPGKDERVSRAPVAQPRKLSLFVNERPNVFGSYPGYGFVLQEGAPPPPDSVRPSGSPIVLTRGQPVEIKVVNRTHEAVTVHWHGVELESYYDGVGGWSGLGGRVAPAIEPGKSFIVRMTPRRAGTFIYHTHNEEGEQLASGLYGPLIVVNPGEVRDTVTDRIFLMGSSGPGAGAPAALNGFRDPPPIQLASNTAYRVRFINIAPSNTEVIGLLDENGTPVKWRTFAKDGAELPAQQVTDVPAQQVVAAGETYDYTFIPEKAENLTLQITTYEHPFKPKVMRVPVIVK